PDVKAISQSEPEFRPGNESRFVAIDDLRARNGLTIQLVAGNLEQTALTVLERYPELKDAVYTRGERNGEPWFMVIYGQYQTRTAAQNALSELPQALRGQSPWIRSAEGL
ncbi:SPOR domain-containing protein, partial [Marinobacter sp. F4218]|uniref:SPOR domain-containing protein n=1 Tax=Marinobacter sp. F4218 TaxID=2862868 RepID=UPI001C639381